MKLWELIKICSEGGYIRGDEFKNSKGEVFRFNGRNLVPNGYVFQVLNVNDEYEYVEKEVK